MTSIITGGAKGIGAATARRLHTRGPVAIWDADADAAHALAAELGEGALAVGVDVADRASVEHAYSESSERLGLPQVLVNNAGIREILPFLELDEKTWHRVLDVNLGGVFHCAQVFARDRVDRGCGGVIVNVASASGLAGFAGRNVYTASKHGVVGLTKTLAMELAPHGIRVVAVAPGFIRTPLTEHYVDDPGMIEYIEATTPLGRWGDPDDIAATIEFVASPLASFITGTTISVDGGLLAGVYGRTGPRTSAS